MRRLLETVAACRNVELTRASALVGPRRAVYATDGSLPGELASAAFAVAAKLLRDGGFPLRDERLAQGTRFAHVERIVYWLPERAAVSEVES
jgi:hypothetical protein